MAKRMEFDHNPGSLLDRSAERLTIVGFRCWMAGYEFRDIDCWETAWIEFSNTLGPKDARATLSELQFWIRLLRQVSSHNITWFPHCCHCISKHEYMALSLISSHQHQDHSTARAAAHYLSGLNNCSALQALLNAGGGFASALADAGQILPPVTLGCVENIAKHGPQSPTERQTRH